MTAIVLPDTPGPLSITPRLITSRSENTPAFGGEDQRFTRMGSRYALDVRMEPMTYEDAQEWADLDDEEATLVFAIPQPDLDTGAPGSPVVDGSGQSGSTLDLAGLTPQYVLRKNQWISVITGGRRYCYRAKAETIVGSDGTVSLPLRTMLRKPHLDGDVVEVAEPKIEGFPTLPEDVWAIDGQDRLVHLSFTLKERA